MEPSEIAIQAAREHAQRITDEQKDKHRPLSFNYARNWEVANNIGEALFNAGYSWHEITAEQRQEIAAQALRECGYPEHKGE